METILARISEEIKSNKKVAMAIVTNVEGATPATIGATMGIFEDRSIIGSVGGGETEAMVIEKAMQCMEDGKSGSFVFDTFEKAQDASIMSKCGAKTHVFIRVYNQKPKLLLVGGGHVAHELYKFGKTLDFSVTIFEDRKDFCTKERFPEADELICGNVSESLQNYNIDENCYVIMVSRGHKQDQDALKAVVTSDAKYIGMIGSKHKVKEIFDNLRKEGISERLLSKVYSPIGLAIGGRKIQEIALGIMAEVVLVKNGGFSTHMKYISQVK